MGLIRGALVLFLGTLLFVSFLAMNTFATFSSSLSYESVAEGIQPLVQGMAQDSGVSAEILGNMNLTKIGQAESAKILAYCRLQNMSSYNFSYEGFLINVPCETAANGSVAIVNETISDVIQGIYYKQYECDFWDCFSVQEFPFFLISEKAHDYWKGKFWLALIVSFVLVALIVLFMNERINAPIIIGILLAISALPLLKLAPLLSFIVGEPASFVIGIFFSKSSLVFWTVFIIGLVLILTGIAMKILNIGFIKKLAENDKKETETSQANKESEPKKTQKKKK